MIKNESLKLKLQIQEKQEEIRKALNEVLEKWTEYPADEKQKARGGLAIDIAYLSDEEERTDWISSFAKKKVSKVKTLTKRVNEQVELHQMVDKEEVEPKKKEKPLKLVYQRDGAYHKKGGGPITNFIIIPKTRVQIDGQEHLKAEILTQADKKYRHLQFSPESWIGKRNFKKALGGILDLEYKGSEDDIQDIKGILASQNPPIKKGVDTMGLHQIHKKWVYVEGELACDKDGERKDIIYLSDNPYRVTLLKEKTLTSSELDQILECLFDFNAEDIVYPLLGFCFACFVKERIPSVIEKRQNPILVSWGEKGSGKTSTFMILIKRLFGIHNPPENIADPTKFAFARMGSSSNLTPLLFDEHKPGTMSDKQKRNISSMIKSIYNQYRFTRGKPDLGLVEWNYTAPVAISGEMGITEHAIDDRIIETYFSRKKIQNRQGYFRGLAESPLGSLGKDFLLWTLSLEQSQIKQTWLEQMESVDKELKDRFRENTAHARLGLALFSEYLKTKGKEPLHSDLLGIIDEAQKVNILEAGNKSIVDSIIEAFSLMAEEGKLEEGKHYKLGTSDLRVALYVSGIYPLFRKWAWETKWDGELLDKASFLKQLKEATYFVENKNIRFGEKTRYGAYLDLFKMEYLEVEGFKE